jgi:hypothetical protein
VQKKLTQCDPAYVDVASTEALSRPERDDTRPRYNHSKSDQADLSPEDVSRSCVQSLHRDLGVRGPRVGNDARLEQEIQHANCEHKSASVHSGIVVSGAYKRSNSNVHEVEVFRFVRWKSRKDAHQYAREHPTGDREDILPHEFQAIESWPSCRQQVADRVYFTSEVTLDLGPVS